MAAPALIATIDGVEAVRLSAPAVIAPRDWILGVVAVQVEADARGASARLRAHRTGDAAPTLVPLRSGALVAVTLAEEEAGRASPAPSPPARDSPAGALGLSVHLDGSSCARALLAPARAVDRALRAYGHVFCRWLRDGGHEAGFDLTDFVAPEPGEKYPRLVSRPLAPGQTVSYRVLFG